MIRVDVVSDTPEWEHERRNSIGASEAPAVLGLSPYATPLDIWKQKKGIDRPFDPVLSMIGHRSEAIMHEWLEKHSGLDIGSIGEGFMARMDDRPWLHASFDRVCDPFLTVQMKTAHFYAGHHWDEGVPTDIRVQVQSEMAVSGKERALVVVWIGGREFRYFWEDRDDKFIDEYLLPGVDAFWHDHVLTDVPPPPSNLAEVNAEFPSEVREVALADNAFEALERITLLNSDIQAQEAERDALKVALAQFVGTADTLTYEGRKVATWKTQKGRVGFDRKALEAEHPDIAAQYMTVGQPFRVLRRSKTKETK